MSVKIRLQRHGRKKRAFFHIVVADSRAPRDGRFISKLGSYNPVTNPATIDLNLDKAVEWLFKGAQPTDTARAILSYKGAMYKHHLQTGVNKGAISQEQADEKFSKWLEEKTNKVEAKRNKLATAKADLKSGLMKQEAVKRQQIAEKVAAKLLVANEMVSEEATEAEEIPAAEEIAADNPETAADSPEAAAE
jgi:small subunit ribosomal protein S16